MHSKTEMDSCTAVEREVTKVTEKFDSLRAVVNKNCSDALSKLETIRAQLVANPQGKLRIKSYAIYYT
jgi:hypothetical protein